MDFINIIINGVIFVDLIVILFLVNVSFIEYLYKKYDNVSFYKIKNMFFTVVCNYFYVIIFIFFLNYLRILRRDHLLDLKIVYSSFIKLINVFSCLTLKIQIITIFFIVLITLVLLLNIIAFYKYLLHQIYLLYLNARYHPEYKYDNKIFSMKILTKPYENDLISYFIYTLSFKLTDKFIMPKNNEINYYLRLPWFHFHRIISKTTSNFYYKKFLIPFSPLFVIVYDCYYYDFVLTHIYYYMLLYVPLMLWRKFTILISTENFAICELVWNILYKKENCIYALPQNHYKLFEIYLMQGLKTIDKISSSNEMDDEVSEYLLKASKFVYNKVENCFENIEGIEIHDFRQKPLNKTLIVTRWVESKETKENWVLIMDKTITDE